MDFNSFWSRPPCAVIAARTRGVSVPGPPCTAALETFPEAVGTLSRYCAAAATSPGTVGGGEPSSATAAEMGPSAAKHKAVASDTLSRQ